MKKSIVFTLSLIAGLSAGAGNEWKILQPCQAPKVYEIAAQEFQNLYRQVTGVQLEIVMEPGETGNLVVLGTDTTTAFSRKAVETKLVPSFALGVESDAYRIRSAAKDGRKYLFLAGGTGRGTLYAVYDFFERQTGCRYFWDGDRVPKSASIPMENLDILESPRFDYRGLRYFAHRSLDRFQAEHWGSEQWDREIDWILKKRLNLFMLRIGMDDVYQKAFPDIVPYPPTNAPLPEAVARSYDDRTSAWDLRYRGQLRKHILQYARDRSLMHPEDTGTMTHWYSRTPHAFLDAMKPTFFKQSEGYGGATAGIWDIRDDRNLENYWKLTQASIDNYGSPELFHTIGLAERSYFKDHAQQFELKCYAFRRIVGKVREHYPNATMMIASWDFYCGQGGWTGDEVSQFLAELNPRTTLILDYTSDLPKDASIFTEWNVIGKFPYTFGIFGAYEAESELRGNYANIKARLPLAANDPMCKGFIYWPEISHTDPLMIEFFTRDAWQPKHLTPEEIVADFCRDRYAAAAPAMEAGWRTLFPLIQAHNIVGPNFRNLAAFMQKELTSSRVNAMRGTCKAMAPLTVKLPGLWKALAELPYGKGDAMVDRDTIDLVRTAAGRLFTVALFRYAIKQSEWLEGKASVADVRKTETQARGILTGLRDALALHDDYSMNVSMARLKTVAPVNPAFEQALKGNSENGYCRSYISEFCDYYYLPQFEQYAREINKLLDAPQKPVKIPAKGTMDTAPIVNAFYAKPLAEMKSLGALPRTNSGYRQLIARLATTMSD